MTVSVTLRRTVVIRADNRCEYCMAPQKLSGAQMQIDHIIPTSKGGQSVAENLCLSCGWCNSFKSNKTEGIDPTMGETAPLFNPRMQLWHEHFDWDESKINIIGLTATGRATISALQINNQFVLPARRHWASAGWYPPTIEHD